MTRPALRPSELECALVPKKRKEAIRRWLAQTDCFAMKKQVDQLLEDVFAAIRVRAEQSAPVCPPPETSALRAPVSSRGQTGENRNLGGINTPNLTPNNNKRLVS